MSGAEVIGLVSGIIAIVDAVVKIHDAAKEASGFPGAFREADRRMPLLKNTMLAVQNALQDAENEESFVALKQVLESCKEKAETLEKIFQEVAVAPEASRVQRYASAVRTLGKGRRLEELMDGILTDVQLLTANYAIKASTRTRVKDMLRNAGISEDLPSGGSTCPISNYGAGSQNIHTGNGNQNINTGAGGQFNGHFEGPFNFPAPTIGERPLTHRGLEK